MRIALELSSCLVLGALVACATARSGGTDAPPDAAVGADAREAPDARGPCGPATCEGCCDESGACQPGGTDALCGAGGAACQACGEGAACAEQACGIAPDSQWSLVVVSGTVEEFDCGDDGYYDSIDSPPDPFAILTPATLPPSRTLTDSDTLAPSWNATLPAGRAIDLLDEGLDITLLDDDDNPDDPIGHCRIPVAQADFAGGDLDLACARDCTTENSGFTVQARLEPAR